MKLQNPDSMSDREKLVLEMIVQTVKLYEQAKSIADEDLKLGF